MGARVEKDFEEQEPYRKENTMSLKWEFELSFEKFKLSEYGRLSLHFRTVVWYKPVQSLDHGL